MLVNKMQNLIFKLVLIIGIIGIIKTSLGCREPDALPEFGNINNMLEQTMQITPRFERYGKGGLLTVSDQSLINIQRTYHHGSTTCTENSDNYQIEQRIQYFPQRSTCPWYFVKNRDDNRIPRELIEARCSCGDDHKCGGDDESRCKPVYFYRKVLRRDACVNGQYLYKAVFEPIVAGCTCVRGALPALIAQHIAPANI